MGDLSRDRITAIALWFLWLGRCNCSLVQVPLPIEEGNQPHGTYESVDEQSNVSVDEHQGRKSNEHSRM